MVIVECEQNSPEWLAARAGYASASVFDVILGKPGTTRDNLIAQLAVETLTGRPIGGGFENAATRQGHAREAEARDRYQVETGELVRQVGFIRHDRLRVGCSPDALLLGERGGLEVKAPQVAAHMRYLRLPEGKAPAEYRAQTQGQMWLAELAFVDFVSYSSDFPDNRQFLVRRVLRDQAYIDRLAAEVELFCEDVAKAAAELR